jgi:hypothetical protein
MTKVYTGMRGGSQKRERSADIDSLAKPLMSIAQRKKVMRSIGFVFSSLILPAITAGRARRFSAAGHRAKTTKS